MIKKQKFRKIKLKVGSTALALVLTMDGIIALGLSKSLVIDKSNPFNGSIISSNDFLDQYKILKSSEALHPVSSSEEIKEYVENMNDEEKKVYLLYYAILYNPSLTYLEKNLVTGAVKYFYDNEYIDAKYVYNKLIDTRVIERNATFPGTNIGSIIEYRLAGDGSIIGSGTIKLGREIDIFHEYIAHGTSKNHFISWIEEGYAGILESEYGNSICLYPVESSVIKFLCEIMGKESAKECFFKLHALSFKENDWRIDLLTSYLSDAGIPAELSEELYLQMDDFSKFRGKILTNEEYQEKKEILESIVIVLSKIYNNANNKNALNRYVCDTYLSNILNEKNKSEDENVNNLYYFNINVVKELSSIENIRKFYPLSNFKEDLNISDEEFAINFTDYQNRYKIINNKAYMELTEEEALLCDSSKMEYYLVTYNTENGKCGYRLNKEQQIWELIEVYKSAGLLDLYLDFQGNSKSKSK